jgi:hypothetical protein
LSAGFGVGELAVEALGGLGLKLICGFAWG